MSVNLDEEVGELLACLPRTLLAALDRHTDPLAGANLRRACDLLSENVSAHLDDGDMASPITACLDAAVTAGGGQPTFEALRRELAAASHVFTVTGLIQSGAIVLCLIREADIVKRATFRSRDEVQALSDRLGAAFREACEIAAARRDAPVYRSLMALHAAVTRELTSRSRPLPRIVTVEIGRFVPAIAAAYRLYGDAGRAGELIAENAVRHPLFMPPRCRALAA